MSIASLEKRIYNCKYSNSKECQGRFNYHPIPGYGSAHPKFLVLGINPALRKGIWRLYDKTQKSLQEKYRDECLSTKNGYGYGTLLTTLEQEIPDFNIRENVYLTDIVKCPTVKGLPSSEMMQQCRIAYLQETIEMLKPEVIIALGAMTANQLCYVKNESIQIITANHPSRATDVSRIVESIKGELGLIDNNGASKTEMGSRTKNVTKDFPLEIQEKHKSSSKNIFDEALNLWLNRQVDERPKIGSRTCDFFTVNLVRYVDSLMKSHGFYGLKIKAGLGQFYKWAKIPWVGIRNDNITDNFQHGVFIVYIFAPEYRNLYLTMIMGVEKQTPEEISMNVSALRKKVPIPEGFTIGIEGKLASYEPLNSTPDKYKRGTLYSKKYVLSQLPDSAVNADLKNALDAYQIYARTLTTR